MNTITNKSESRHKNRDKNEAMEIQVYQARLEILYEVAQQANSITEVSELLEEILQVTQRTLHASASSLLLINEEKGDFYLQAAGGEKSSLLKQTKLGLETGIIGWVARNGKPVIVNDAYKDKHFNQHVDEATGFTTRSIIAAPISRGQTIIGVLEIINKEDDAPFDDRDLLILTGFASTEALILLVSMAATAINNIKLSQAIQEKYRSTVETLATAADTKDPYASGHSRRVKEYALMAAHCYGGFSTEELQSIEFGALLHDIGKIGINDAILRKTEPLTPGEWYIIRKHALRGANIVSEIPCLEDARDIILYHHEKYDGTGYPEGLKGEEIPIGARLVSVADAFDTMTTDHSYRTALSLSQAMSELINGIGVQFCHRAVEAFIRSLQKYKDNPVIEIAEEDRACVEQAMREAEGKARQEAPQAAAEEPVIETEAGAGAELDEEAGPQTEAIEPEAEAEKASPDICTELYRGDVELGIKSPVDFKQINLFKKCLRSAEGLKIVLDGWSEDEGSIIVITLLEPLPLVGILSQMPIVEQVYKRNKDLLVTLKPLS